ncbi:MAG: hypothetical protein AAB805_00875 [Patescibacteria group bacterium]
MTTYLKLFFFTLAFAIFLAPFALAEEGATTTQEIATTTVEIAQPTIVETVATTSAVGADATTTPATSESAITTSDTNSQEEPTAETATSTEVRLPLPSNESQTSVEQQNQPEPTMVERIVEVIREVPVYVQERAFDPATAPGTVSLSVRMPDGTPPTVSVFASFVGVGGKTFGGPLDKDGAITVTMPQGRYYTEFLVVDTRYGPPNDPPSFFLDANEEQTFGPLLLSHTSSFTDTALEAEVEKTLSEEKGGMAKILSLIVKLLLAILREIRGLRSELVSFGDAPDFV